MSYRYITCNNCNKKGHISSNCPGPVTSYGILLFRVDDNIPKILMINRKDSLCYIDFIRGKYNSSDTDYIQILIDKFSSKEKQNILSHDFESLWKKLWLIEDIKDIKMKFRNHYKDSKIKFEKIKSGVFSEKLNKTINLSYFVNKSDTNYITSEWEIPKGRKIRNETNINCTNRECEEETNYNLGDYDNIYNLPPFYEVYMGENKIKYRHIYYLSMITNNKKKVQLNKNKQQQLEVADMDWLTKTECLFKIRDYQKTRYNLINEVFLLLNNLEDYIIL